MLFSADWAEQCGQIKTVLDELAKQSGYSQVQFLEVAAEELSTLSLKHKVYESHSNVEYLLIDYLCPLSIRLRLFPR